MGSTALRLPRAVGGRITASSLKRLQTATFDLLPEWLGVRMCGAAQVCYTGLRVISTEPVAEGTRCTEALDRGCAYRGKELVGTYYHGTGRVSKVWWE